MAGLSLCIPLILSYGFGEDQRSHLAFGVPAALAIVIWLASRQARTDPKGSMGSFDAFAAVSLGWLTIVVLGALPYWITGTLPQPENAWFESMSGFTTTGASVIQPGQLEQLDSSILLWRSLTQWLGGMGVVVLFVALLPSLGAGGSFLVQLETPGPASRRVKPRIAECARILWKIYIVLTGSLVLILMLSGLGWFDAVCHAFSTVATGGFSTKGDSIGHFRPLVQWEIMVFMLISGVNFSLLYLFFQRRPRQALQDPELRTYLTLVAVAILVFATVLCISYELPGEETSSAFDVFHDKVRHSAFTAISIITGSGFGTDDFDRWPDFCRVLIVVLMISGACAGSTTGGMKLIRAILVFKYVRRELFRVGHPSAVRHIKLQKRTIAEPLVTATMGFCAIYVVTWVFGVLVLELLGVDSSTSISASLASLANVGPGLGGVGPSKDYSELPTMARVFLPWLMLLGRLEFYAVLMLFVPAMWRRPRR